MLAELPDLWDVNVAGALGNDSKSRALLRRRLPGRSHVAFVKAMTTKPVVTVGRFTSPDLMVSRSGAAFTDFIGAARPSIADPFLPTKIREGREDEIRECIGCNICRAANNEARALALHAEPDHGRGMAARLASGANSSRNIKTRMCWWWAAGRRGSNAHWPSASAAMR